MPVAKSMDAKKPCSARMTMSALMLEASAPMMFVAVNPARPRR